jgi:hypothetical protein
MNQAQYKAKEMLRRVADFFHFMSNNKEKRLYYVLPINAKFPYAYQHSLIRDIATICDILDLVQLFDAQTWELPKHEKATINLIIKRLLEQQHPDGSLNIFFDKSLKPYEGSAEAFYLPEALIALIAALKRTPNIQIEKAVQSAIAYLCKEANRKRHLAADYSTFYFNWQSQLLYHWIPLKIKKERANLSLEITHLQSLIEAIRNQGIARITFTGPVATVEVACYFEGLVHAQRILEMLELSTMANASWVSKEIDRALAFLYELQSTTLESFHGGFINARGDNEARVDVAGHVFGGLRFLV